LYKTKINKSMRHNFFLLICLLGSCFGAVQAQQSSVGITPASVDARVKRGASYTQTFTIANKTGAALKFRSSVQDIWYDEQNKRVTGRPGTLQRSASTWIQFTPTEFIVENNASATVKAVITVPLSAAGSFYAVPVFEGTPVDKPVTQANVSTASIGIRFRGLIMLTTDEGAEYNIEIIAGKVSPPTASTELELNLDLHNRGTAHAKLRGAFAILNAAGALAGRGNFTEKRLFPAQRNFIQTKWAGELLPGKYVCIVTLSYDRIGTDPTSIVYEMPFEVK
jgi:hypothetical protein